MSIICIAAQKGGVGKTTVAVNLAVALTRIGKTVLLVDTDPQGNATDTVGAVIDDTATLYDLLTQQCEVDEAIQHLGETDIIAADPLLSSIETALAGVIGKEYRLRDALGAIASSYDYILIDTPPQIGLLLLNALTAADEVIIPFSPDRYALAGIAQLADTIASTRRYLNPSLRILGLLGSMVRERERLTREVSTALPEIANQLGTQVFETSIRKAMGVRTAQTERHSLFEGQAKYSVATYDFIQLAHEINEKEEMNNG